MALENKILPQAYRSIDINQYNFLRKKEGGDTFFKFLLFIAVALSMYIYSFALFSQTAEQEDEYVASMYLIAALIASTFIVIIMLALLLSKNARLSNSSHLFAFKKDPGKYKIVDNFSDSSVSVSASINSTSREVDEDGNPIFYAEEVFDDEDNIFAIEEASTLLKKEKSITYADLTNNFNECLESWGVTGDLAANVLASMAFSRLIDVTKVLDVVPILLKVLDNPTYVIHYTPNDTFTNQKVLYNTFEYAKTHPNIPVFMVIDEIPAKDYMNYLRPLYRYIDDLNGDYYINVNGAMVHIPHNIYFLTALKSGDVIFDISRRYLRYVSILKADYRINKENVGDRKKMSINNEQLVNARRNAMDSYAIEEATFKKLDGMFNMANEANGYVLQNKIQRKIEDYSAVLLALDINEEDVMDRCLANNVMAAVVISADPTKLTKDYNLTTLLENEFGQDKMKYTKNVIKDYLSLFNSRGERNNG